MNKLRYILLPFSFVYWCVTRCRNFLFDWGLIKSTAFEVPTIVVGNLSVGGTGKTPQVEYLVRLLKHNYNLAILSRGYKRKSKGFVLANGHMKMSEIGDEPFQYVSKFPEIDVAVDSNRVRGINQLNKLDSPPDAVLLDDAFQHRRLKGGFNILLTSYTDLFTDDWILPVGNLREGAYGAKRAQQIVVTKCPELMTEEEMAIVAAKLRSSEDQEVFFASIIYDQQLKGVGRLKLSELNAYEVLLVTGIANPKPLKEFLMKKGVHFEHMKFPDHHNFTAVDVFNIEKQYKATRGKKKLILTTEKDYSRLNLKIDNLYYLGIQTKFLAREQMFNEQVKAYVRKNSRNS